MKTPEEIYAACVTQHCTPDEYDGKVKAEFIAAIRAERERISELEKALQPFAECVGNEIRWTENNTSQFFYNFIPTGYCRGAAELLKKGNG